MSYPQSQPKLLTPEETRRRVEQIKRESHEQMDALFADVLASRQFADNQVLQRTRLNPDGSVFDQIQGVIVAASVSLMSDEPLDFAYPNVHYWVRVTTPGYQSRQECWRHGLAMDEAEDFWQGDARWIAL